jgi:hypothetical protein
MPATTAASRLEPEAIQAAVIDLLIYEGERPWATQEIARIIGDQVAAADALRALEDDGLIHRLPDGFFIASRPATRMHALIEQL